MSVYKMVSSKLYEISDDDFINIMLSADSYSDMCRKCNLHVTGGNINTIKRRLTCLGFDTDNVKKMFPQRRLYKTQHHFYNDKELRKYVFCEHSHAKYLTLKKYMIRRYHIEYKCAICGQLPLWQNQRLVLQIDHINGNHHDCRLDNLRFLCPNCHSQTATWSGRNIKSW